MSLSSPWYEHVASGRKRYEGRRLTAATTAIAQGDTITFKHHTDPLLPSHSHTVVAVHVFPCFRAALEALPLDQVLPDVASVEEGCEVYERYVSLPTQLRYGVVMLELSSLGNT